MKVLKKKENYTQIASVKTLFGYMCSVYLLPTAPMMHERFESKIEHVNGSLMMHSQPFIASNRPKQGIKLGLKLLILVTCDPNGDQMKVAFHQ